jgi:hypothetical protein
MAMAGATRTTMDAALKNLYLPTMVSTINTSTVLLSRIEARTDMTSVSGRQAVVPVNIRGSQAMGARADGGTLPTPQNQTYVEMAVPYRFLYGTVRFTHPTIASTRDVKGAWARVASAEMDGLRRDIQQDVNRQLYGYGCSVLGIAGTTNGSDTATLAMANLGHHVKVGMVLDSWNALTSGTKALNSVAVTAVSGLTVTIDPADTYGTSDFIVREDSMSGASTGLYYEMMGLMGIVDDPSVTAGIGPFCATLQGIARGTYPEWDSNVMENSTAATGRAISAPLLDEAILTPQTESGKKVSIGITSPLQWRRIGDLLVGDRRYTDTMDLAGGFTAIQWAGVPITWDNDCKMDVNGNDMLFFLCEDELARYQLADWDWDDTDGNILARNSGVASYDATLFYYGNFGTTDPKAHVVIRDLSRA